MADKEATVYVVDVGRSMGDRRHGRSVSDLDYAMRYVWDRVTATVSILGRASTTLILNNTGSHWSQDRYDWRARSQDRQYAPPPLSMV